MFRCSVVVSSMYFCQSIFSISWCLFWNSWPLPLRSRLIFIDCRRFSSIIVHIFSFFTKAIQNLSSLCFLIYKKISSRDRHHDLHIANLILKHVFLWFSLTFIDSHKFSLIHYIFLQELFQTPSSLCFDLQDNFVPGLSPRAPHRKVNMDKSIFGNVCNQNWRVIYF